MTVVDLLQEMRQLGIDIRADGEKLIVDAPAGAVTPAISDAIRLNKAALIKLFEHADESNDEQEIDLLRAPDENRLSLAQERIWAIDQLNPDSGQFNLPGSWWLDGNLDLGRFTAAIEQFEARHEIFRRRFTIVDGSPRVTAPDFKGVDFRITTLPEIGASTENDPELANWLAKISREPMDLAQDAPLRVIMLTVHATRHLLVVISHSAVWDAWCYDLFLSELGALYDSRPSENSVDLPKHQYSDYVRWQRERQHSSAVTAALDAAIDQIKGIEVKARLPVDYPDPDPADHSGARFNFLLPRGLHSELKDYARTTGATPFMVLLAAYAALLCRYTGKHKILVTIPTRGREKRELENIYGPFTNHLFLPIQVAGHTFASLLADVKEKIGMSFGGEVPSFERLVESLNQNLADSGFFQLQFSYQNVEDRKSDWATDVDLTTGPQQDFHAAHADISFWLREGRSVVDGAIDYRTSIFDESSVETFHDRLLHLTEHSLKNPDTPIHEFDFDRDNGGISNEKSLTTKHDPLVELRNFIERSGELAIVSTSNSTVSGHQLEGLIDSVTQQRLSDSCPNSLLPLILSFGTLASGRMLLLDEEFERACLDQAQANDWIRENSAGDVSTLSMQAADLTYPEQAIKIAVSAWFERFSESQKRIMIADSKPTPALVTAWLAVLASGRHLCLPTATEASDELSLCHLIKREKPDLVVISSSMFDSLLAIEGLPTHPRYLVRVRPGTSGLAQRAAARGVEFNLLIAEEETLGIGLIGSGLGWPLPFERLENGIVAQVLDDQERDQLVGTDGRLALSFADMPRHEPDPQFMMRVVREKLCWPDMIEDEVGDQQRLIDSLLTLDSVQDAHVERRSSNTESTATVAWIVQELRSEMTTSEIRRRLLGTGMRPPAVIVNVDEIPRDQNGMVIRRDLVHPDVATQYAGYEPPSTQQEKAFADIWRNVLKIDRISIHDTFANLGGNSVQALVVLSETQKDLGWSFEPRLLFFQSLKQIVEHTPEESSSKVPK